jgi:hydroxymethylpyrimidine pyrophosphatase-like HAD family hydrolase
MGTLETFSKGVLVTRKQRRRGVHESFRPLELTLSDFLKIVKVIANGSRTPWLMFDVDGVLIHAGLETLGVHGTLKSYVAKNKAVIGKFKRRITNLKKLGFNVALNTGRGAEFARRVVSHIFPSGSVSKIVCESGALIVSMPDGQREETFSPKSVSEDGLAILSRHRDEIIAFGRHLGAEKERGEKEIILSLNPHPSMSIEHFFKEMKDWIERNSGMGQLEVNHSKTAVDISPLGVDKRAALEEAIGDGIVAYFGDAPGDEQAMRVSEVNITPGNALPSTKEVARNATFGLVVEEKGQGLDELYGVVEALRVIELYMRFGKRSESKGKVPKLP